MGGGGRIEIPRGTWMWDRGQGGTTGTGIPRDADTGSRTESNHSS